MEIGRTKVQGRYVGYDKSFAQALKGESSKAWAEKKSTLHIQPSGNSWLFRSAVAVMNKVVSMMTLNISF